MNVPLACSDGAVLILCFIIKSFFKLAISLKVLQSEFELTVRCGQIEPLAMTWDPADS